MQNILEFSWQLFLESTGKLFLKEKFEVNCAVTDRVMPKAEVETPKAYIWIYILKHIRSQFIPFGNFIPPAPRNSGSKIFNGHSYKPGVN